MVLGCFSFLIILNWNEKLRNSGSQHTSNLFAISIKYTLCKQKYPELMQCKSAMVMPCIAQRVV